MDRRSTHRLSHALQSYRAKRRMTCGPATIHPSYGWQCAVSMCILSTRGRARNCLPRLRNPTSSLRNPTSTVPQPYPCVPRRRYARTDYFVDGQVRPVGTCLRRSAHDGMVTGNSRFDGVRTDRLSVCQQKRATCFVCLRNRDGVEVTLMADRRAATPAPAHGVARRLLVFKLPDQLALCFADSAGDVRILGDRY